MTAHFTKSAIATAASASMIALETQGGAGIDALIAKLKNADDTVRGPAWQNAAIEGALAVKPLASLMADGNFETARCAKRALHKIVHHAGRPGAKNEAKSVASQLIPLLKSAAVPVQREILWMLSVIGGEDAVAPMAAMLASPDVRDDARCALMRLPFPQTVAVLKTAFTSSPEEFKYALAESLRQLGQKVDGYPSQKLVPTRKTIIGN